MNYLILINLLFLITFFKSSQTKSWNSNNNINSQLLSTVKSFMNTQINPCQDFYQYACGNWESNYENTNYLDTIGRLEYENNRILKEILEQRILSKKRESNNIYHKVREYYETCKEQETFDALEYLKILKPTNEENLEWPEIEETWVTTDKWNIWSSLGRLQAIGFNGFLLTLDMKNRNATYFHLHLDKGKELGFTAYEQTILDNMDGSLNTKARLLSSNIQGFIKKLAILYRNHNQNFAIEMDLNELQRKVVNLDSIAYFKAILGEQSLDHLPLVVANLAFYRKLADLIQKTSQDTLIHILKLKFLGFIEKRMPKISSPIQCLQHMRDLVPLALDYIYEEEIYKYQRNTSDVIIQQVFQTMQQKFKSILQQHSRDLKGEEMEFLIDKIENMKLNIGNLPQVSSNNHFYQEYFNSWDVIKGYFYWNHLNILQHRHTERYNLLNLQSYSAHHTYFHWPYGSPAYQPTANLLIIPHTYLQYPIFHPEFHELFLFAELGNTLGHEMIHAFDTNGLQYDGQGNPSSIFTESLPDKQHYMSFLECVSKQRPTSLNEKIADFTGFRLAYDSYFRRPLVPKFREEPSLSNKQLFFIKFAQFFCAVSPKRIHYDDTHDTPFQRVPQVVSNHQEFEQIFACQRKTGKALVEKCTIW